MGLEGDAQLPARTWGYGGASESLKEEAGSSWDDTDRHFPPQDALPLSSLPLQLQKQRCSFPLAPNGHPRGWELLGPTPGLPPCP